MDSVAADKVVSKPPVAETAEARTNAVRPMHPAVDVALAAEPPAGRTGRTRRMALLAVAGAVTIALAYAFAPRENEVVVVDVNPAAARSRDPSGVARAGESTPALKRIARGEIALAAATDPFVGTSFVPPPPAPVAAPPPPPPPPPKAPPLPYTFVGLLEQGAGKPAAFLARGEALFVVSAGDIVESDYRIESLSPTEIVLTYLPLSERQRLSVSGAHS